jgi:hypothetical protein
MADFTRTIKAAMKRGEFEYIILNNFGLYLPPD